MTARCLLGLFFLVGLGLPGCATSSAVERSGTPDRPQAAPEERSPAKPVGLGWRSPGPGEVGDPQSGFVLELPRGWVVRPGEESVLWVLRAPGWDDLGLTLEAWDGDADQLREEEASPGLGYLSGGPHAGLEAVADEPPWVRTRLLKPSGFEFAWFFRVSGRGLLIRAALPELGFEAGWRAVDEIVRSASVREL